MTAQVVIGLSALTVVAWAVFGGEGGDQVGGTRGLALGDRGGQRPLVDHGGGEQLVHGRRQRERGAARVGERRERRVGPAQLPAREVHALRPAGERRGVPHAGFEHGAGAVEEPVVAGQAARLIPRRCGIAGQSEASGAKRMPRSSRIRPSSDSGAAASAGASTTGAGAGAGACATDSAAVPSGRK